MSIIVYHAIEQVFDRLDDSTSGRRLIDRMLVTIAQSA